MTPTVTPSVEMNEITEMNACFRLASRYRSATWSSNGMFMLKSYQLSAVSSKVAIDSTIATQRTADELLSFTPSSASAETG